jgi:hypothetical protein
MKATMKATMKAMMKPSRARNEKGATRAIQHHIRCVGRMLVARFNAATWMVTVNLPCQAFFSRQ